MNSIEIYHMSSVHTLYSHMLSDLFVLLKFGGILGFHLLDSKLDAMKQ